MKRHFFTLFALLIAGMLFATDEMTVTYQFTSRSWTATLGSDAANWISGKDGANFNNGGVGVTTGVTGANATCPHSYNNISKVVVTYRTNKSAGEGTFDVKIGENDVTSQDWECPDDTEDGRNEDFYAEFNYASPQSGAVKLTVNTTTNSAYVRSVAITYAYDAADPVINAKSINLGNVFLLDQEVLAVDTAVEVTTAKLTEAITVTCPAHITTTESTLPKAGGTLHMHISAPLGAFEETVSLTSSGASRAIIVTGLIKENITLPGTAAVMAAGTNASSATVNGLSAIKAGTGDNRGNMTISVPANAGVLHFYAAAWKGEAGILTVSADADILGALNSITLQADTAIAGTSSNFILSTNTPTIYRFNVPLSNVTEPATITLSSETSANAKRFVVWGATYEEAIPSALDNTVSEQKTIKTIENGRLVIIRDGVPYNALGTRIL